MISATTVPGHDAAERATAAAGGVALDVGSGRAFMLRFRIKRSPRDQWIDPAGSLRLCRCSRSRMALALSDGPVRSQISLQVQPGLVDVNVRQAGPRRSPVRATCAKLHTGVPSRLSSVASACGSGWKPTFATTAVLNVPTIAPAALACVSRTRAWVRGRACAHNDGPHWQPPGAARIHQRDCSPAGAELEKLAKAVGSAFRIGGGTAGGHRTGQYAGTNGRQQRRD